MIAGIALFLFSAGFSFTGSHNPAGQTGAGHHQQVNRRGDQVMGFSHSKATHHFRLFTDGGEIAVTANDPDDAATRGMIREHLRQISRQFAAGDFRDPMLIHATTPPGVPTMKELRSRIMYRYADSRDGARVRISTRDPRALQAVHEFLRFQIADHQTGDSTVVSATHNRRN